MRLTLGLLLLVLAAAVVAGCSERSDVLAPENTAMLGAQSTIVGIVDPAGDAFDDPRTDPDPDIVAADVTCGGIDMTFVVHLSPASWVPTGAYVGFHLDTDQNPATGFPGVDLAHNDAGIIGEEFVLYVGDAVTTARLYKFLSLPNNYMLVNSYPVTVLADGFQVSVPVADLDGDDGYLNYKLTAQGVLSLGSWTGVLDYAPDLGLPPGMADGCPGVLMIDIKPGSDPNSVNCQNENALIAVAILSTSSFDALMVDPASVTFEGASEWHVSKKTGEPRAHVEDVNGDGLMDRVFHFRLNETTLTCDDTEGTLMGTLYDGTPVMGTDSIRMVNKLLTPTNIGD